MEKDLSIIIPVYNTEAYIRKCLESVFKSLPENTEVIVVNDGTKDNSEIIIKEFEEKYSDKLIYLKKENGGLSSAKNLGLLKATGKYIAFVDSDDFIDENMHSNMLKTALENNADMVYCDIEEVFENNKVIYINCSNDARDTDFLKAIDVNLMATSCNKLIKKELFENLNYPEGLNNEDVAVTPILFARSKKIIKINKPYYKYYQRTGSIQNSGFSSKRFVMFETVRLCIEKSKEFNKDIQEQIKGSLYTHQILALLIYPISKEKLKKRKELTKEFCDKILNMFGDDFFENIYVKEYANLLGKNLLLRLLKENKYKEISYLLSYYNFIEKILLTKNRINNQISRFFRFLKRKLSK